MRKTKLLTIFVVLTTLLFSIPTAAFASDQVPVSNSLEATIIVEENPVIEVNDAEELVEALEGDYTTIILKTGTYDLGSDLEVDRAVTLKGAEGHEAVVNGSIAIGSEDGISGKVVIDGLKIDAPSGKDGIIINAGASEVDIINNDITTYKNGITIVGGSAVLMDSNKITGSTSSEYATYGVQVGSLEEEAGTINVAFNNNTINGHKYANDGSLDSCGIFLKTNGSLTVGEGYSVEKVTRSNAGEAGAALEAQTGDNTVKVMIVDPESTSADMKISHIWYPVPVNLTWDVPTGSFMTREPVYITFDVSSVLNFVKGKDVVYVIKFTGEDGTVVNAGDITVKNAAEHPTAGEFHTEAEAFTGDSKSCEVTFKVPGIYKLQIYMIEGTE